MFLNENEEKIINKFSENVEIYENKEMILFWDDKNFIKANFDTCFEDENDYEMDEDEYEEFWSFVFKVIEVNGNPPVYVTEDDFFLVNYHNFPKEILVNGKKIN